MIRRWAVSACVLVVCVWLFSGTPVSASTLKITPLRYDASLEKGEKKKGFIDITNPTGETVKVALSVQAFRQIDDSGALEFYDNETIRSGVLLDLDEAELGPRETLHLAFVLDGTKLASGDNFAAIFASTVPSTVGAGEQAIRVGTLFLISNGTPTAHEAVVKNLSGQLVQLGEGLHLNFDVQNTADKNTTTGFSPTITVTAWPYVNDTITGPLVFAGRTRSVEYIKKGNYLGILAITVTTGGSKQTMYRLAITGHWRVFLPIVLTAIALTVWLVRYVRKHPVTTGKSVTSDD